MRIDVISIFPEYLDPLRLSLVGRARANGLLDVRVHDLRRWTSDVHRTVDDAPYGGGPGMVMRPEPWWAALEEITGWTGEDAASVGADPADPADRARVVVPTPSGRPFTQDYAADLAREARLVLCCGRYEGIDARVIEAWADDEISIGDYVLAGGEAASLVIVEAVTRLLPGVVGNADSVADDSFAQGLLEAGAYTRPPVFRGREVPPVLLSGNHGDIARWRRREALRRTSARRPDLIARAELSEPDRRFLAELDPARAGTREPVGDGGTPGEPGAGRSGAGPSGVEGSAPRPCPP